MHSIKLSVVFLLEHSQEDEDGNEFAKTIGIYTSTDEANAAIHRLSDKPGFSDYVNGFNIDAYKLDEDHWTEGFGFE